MTGIERHHFGLIYEKSVSWDSGFAELKARVKEDVAMIVFFYWDFCRKG